MQIRKNTKSYKTLLKIVADCHSRPDREKLVRLYITKAGHSIADRIPVEGIQGGDSGLFYDMGYETVLSNLQSSNHQLMVSDDTPGIYFFHSSSNKIWDEAPFEFDEAVLKEFSSLPELPVARKKEKAEKFLLADANTKTKAPEAKSKKAEVVKPAKREKKPEGPDFKLRHEIHFTNLDKVAFRQSKLNKQGVLEYYDKIAEYILPYLKDRALSTRRETESHRPAIDMNAADLFPEENEELPDWIKHQTFTIGKQKKELLACNDKEHLLYYVETGSLEFDHSLSRIKAPDTPDYLVIGIDSPEFEIAKAVDVVLAAREVFDGLKLRSLVKTDGRSGLHVYMALEPNSSYDSSYRAAEYICKLIRLKIPGKVSLHGSDDLAYGKVTLDYSMNDPGGRIVAPYSLVPGASAIVATPLLWDEIEDGLRLEDFNHESIFRRLKQRGDPLQSIGRKVNADELLARLEENYGFLV